MLKQVDRELKKEIEDCDLLNKKPDLTRTLTGDGWDNVAGTHVIAYHDCTPNSDS